jgi:3-dehydroquinate synthetase
MTRISVQPNQSHYDVLVEPDSIARAGNLLAPYVHNDRLFIVTDSNVAEQWLETFQMSLNSAGLTPMSQI